ncbi:MAG: phosphate:sodium symporter [Treponema sp. CETP13]|nr:MAG: phosphate:sodium symporter [Treponema sp. CETP13]
MKTVQIIFQIIGSLAFLMYGMQMMSEGIQKSAGPALHRALGIMTSNRFTAVFTGMAVTMIIQSSSATTVMVVSFVNAGLLTLKQSVGVIFGANIGTTITAWIVALLGFKFKISLVAVPVFGIGFVISRSKKLKLRDYGEALMGFGLLFLGLSLLSSAMPKVGAGQISFLSKFSGYGLTARLIGVLAGALLTVLIHSSSAATAIIITMAFNGVLSFEFAVAMVLGSNIGTTIDAVLASIGTKVNARRAALVHVLFNVSGSLLAIVFMIPLVKLVNVLIPGGQSGDITTRLAMLHTVFNVLCTLLFIPFVNQLAALTERLVSPRENETPEFYHFEFETQGNRENAEARLIRVKKEVSDMTALTIKMFKTLQSNLVNPTRDFITNEFIEIEKGEEFADQMRDQISAYLVEFRQLPISEETQIEISKLLHIVDKLESLTDDIFSVAHSIKSSINKQMTFSQGSMDRLIPCLVQVQKFLDFVFNHMNTDLTEEEMQQAEIIEESIDHFRKQLKKRARKQIEKGADVKTELLYIDMIRKIEKMGDRAYSISEDLAGRIPNGI